MQRIIKENPFYLLGIFTNDSVKQRTANVSKINAYLRTKKNCNFPQDCVDILGVPNRTTSSISNAVAEINFPENCFVKFLTWFNKISQSDIDGIDYIIKNDLDSAIKIWSGKSNFSSVINLSVCYILKKDYQLAVKTISILFDNDLFFDDFIKYYNETFRSNIQISKNKLLDIYQNLVCKYISQKDFISFLNGSNSSKTVETNLINNNFLEIDKLFVSFSKAALSNFNESCIQKAKILIDHINCYFKLINNNHYNYKKCLDFISIIINIFLKNIFDLKKLSVHSLSNKDLDALIEIFNQAGLLLKDASIDFFKSILQIEKDIRKEEDIKKEQTAISNKQKINSSKKTNNLNKPQSNNQDFTNSKTDNLQKSQSSNVKSTKSNTNVSFSSTESDVRNNSSASKSNESNTRNSNSSPSFSSNTSNNYRNTTNSNNAQLDENKGFLHKISKHSIFLSIVGIIIFLILKSTIFDNNRSYYSSSNNYNYESSQSKHNNNYTSNNNNKTNNKTNNIANNKTNLNNKNNYQDKSKYQVFLEDYSKKNIYELTLANSNVYSNNNISNEQRLYNLKQIFLNINNRIIDELNSNFVSDFINVKNLAMDQIHDIEKFLTNANITDFDIRAKILSKVYLNKNIELSHVSKGVIWNSNMYHCEKKICTKNEIDMLGTSFADHYNELREVCQAGYCNEELIKQQERDWIEYSNKLGILINKNLTNNFGKSTTELLKNNLFNLQKDVLREIHMSFYNAIFYDYYDNKFRNISSLNGLYIYLNNILQKLYNDEYSVSDIKKFNALLSTIVTPYLYSQLQLNNMSFEDLITLDVTSGAYDLSFRIFLVSSNKKYYGSNYDRLPTEYAKLEGKLNRAINILYLLLTPNETNDIDTDSYNFYMFHCSSKPCSERDYKNSENVIQNTYKELLKKCKRKKCNDEALLTQKNNWNAYTKSWRKLLNKLNHNYNSKNNILVLHNIDYIRRLKTLSYQYR